ncbi:hypothetical protein FOB58_005348 [Candida parapsilosis]|uniref:DUF3074 domain-containing protein n=2 Tax=Candida parapsilosis TaxID=5480 RepID=G8B511_CANPC|nr:uncharacterized protein CPAR2_601230 [Candida parapsilosis]KAF6043633.1 hypothetical protein FOB58_005348 [Candida parapsilosis]KAF6043869.1 hypothetical protein FOB59_004825 [Candida parapsilosis]KAF6045511.1 hypothetical protein FOB60_005083 [Candida parapsilosis]KAF6060297.1 hypothetical protein FOB61_005312 [Candida parapsilosis]KAI5904303.1 hypothetical protein K4G60_g3461 [Candida parapsilosis]
MSPSTLPLKEYSVDTPRQTLLKGAEHLLKSVPNWNPGKTYYEDTKHVTKISHDTIDGDYWCARRTALRDIPIDKFKSAIIGTTEIGFTHSDHEINYVHEIESMQVRNIQNYEDNGWSYTIHAIYDFGFPLNKRSFNELVHVFVSNDKALVVSVPIAGEVEGVLGSYVSVEEIKWDADSVEWTVATTSKPGGIVPEWVTKLSIGGAIAKDVPNVLAYIESNKFLVQVG